jgi:outer membrane protein OmpA-like peptidoglycan-associated protein
VDDSFLVQLKQERIEAAELMRNVAGPGADVELPTFTAQDPSYDYTVPGAEGGSVGTLELPNVFFREGSYGLTDDARVTIASIADRLRSFPALCVRIGGHTNSHGDAAANRRLSKYRGLAIAAELTRLDAKAFPKQRFEVIGFGSDTPVLADGAEDPEASRRTEFTLLNCSGAG